LLAEEESSAPAKVKAAPKAVKKVQKPAGPGAIAAGGGLAAVATSEASAPETSKGKVKEERTDEEPESYSATGIDNALDLMEVVTAKMDKASVGQQAAGIERHPEVGGLMSFSLFPLTSFICTAAIQGMHASHLRPD
jgi:hypothetical protein